MSWYSLPRVLGEGWGWGSSEEAPDACLLRRFLVLIFMHERAATLTRSGTPTAPRRN
jgi:hypothetical protein